MSMDRNDLYTFMEDYVGQAQRLSRKKNQDYAKGTDPFQNFNQCGEAGFMTRMTDKLTRLQNLIEREQRNAVLREAGLEVEPNGVTDESLEDTVMDLFNYCWLLAAWRANQRGCWQKGDPLSSLSGPGFFGQASEAIVAGPTEPPGEELLDTSPRECCGVPASDWTLRCCGNCGEIVE